MNGQTAHMMDPAYLGLSRLDSLPRFATAGTAAYVPGLERVEALLEALGRPDRSCPVIHVAGTNGKGSTASLIAAISTAAGFHTGLHTSPHLVHVTERMRLDGVPAPVAWLDQAIVDLAPVLDRVKPSYFEVTVALSFSWFAECGAKLAVVETGLGGRLDATNIVRPEVSVITSIALDHTEILGSRIEDIATEKAGIIKAGVPVVVADSGPAVEAVLASVATRVGAPLHAIANECVVRPGNWSAAPDGDAEPSEAARNRMTGPFRVSTPNRVIDGLVSGLPGAHQQGNMLMALRAIELLGSRIDRFSTIRMEDIRTGIRDVVPLSGLRGRMERIGSQPDRFVDVAHNAEGIRAALDEFIGQTPDAGRRIVLLAVMADKDIRRIASHLKAADVQVVSVGLESERALGLADLEQALSEAGVPVCGRLPEGPRSVAAWIDEHVQPTDAVLAIGSHLVAGPLLPDHPFA